MSAATFDTLTTARELEAAGVERRQAEAIAGAVRQAVSADRDELATKADLAELRAATRTDLYRALWIQAAAFALIVLIAAAGTGVIVLRAVAPSPDAALQAHRGTERRTPAVAALQAQADTASSRAATDPAWWGSGTCTFLTGSPNSRHSFLRGRRCLDGSRTLDPAWWGASTPAPETDHGGQAKTL